MIHDNAAVANRPDTDDYLAAIAFTRAMHDRDYDAMVTLTEDCHDALIIATCLAKLLVDEAGVLATDMQMTSGELITHWQRLAISDAYEDGGQP